MEHLIMDNWSNWSGYVNMVDTLSTNRCVSQQIPILCKSNALDVPMPDWVVCDPGFTPTKAVAIAIQRGAKAVAITYAPTKTLGVGYAKLYIVDKDTGKPFVRMQEMWQVLSAGTDETHILWANNFIGTEHEPTCKIIPTGEIRTAFGVPNATDLYEMCMKLGDMYQMWRRFPNETNWETVKKLRLAEQDVYSVQMYAQQYENEINEARRAIQEYQERIAAAEKNMNDIYEKAAESMNLLEEHGVNVDMNDPAQVQMYPDYDIINPDMYAIRYDPSQSCLIASSSTGECQCSAESH